MADDEVDASGGRSLFSKAKRALGGGANLGNVAAQSAEFKGLSDAINKVTDSLQKLSEKSGGYADKIARDLGKVSGAMSGAAGGPGGTTTASVNYAQQRGQIQTGGGNNPPPGGGGGGGGSPPSTIMSAASWLGGAASTDFVSNLSMAPVRFVRDRIQNNRNVVLTASNMLNMTGLRAGGVSQEKMLEDLSRNIGGVKGTPGELISLLSSASQLGASYGFGTEGATGVRGGGFFQGIRQMQALNPGASVQSMVQTLGGQAANTGANQQSMMMTGGAYSMIGNGGRQKSLSAWADSITKWLTDLRPGDKRGKAFTYNELMSQYYPGSNFDAWFDVNGISPDMREYWWTYVLGKSSRAVESDAAGDLFQVASPLGAGVQGPQNLKTQKNNLAALKLNSTNALTQGEFALGSKLSGSYGNREQSNRAFNEMIQSFLVQALPGALMSGPLAGIAFMPDIIEDLLMGLLERSPGNFKTAFGAGAMGSALFLGDVGDVGDTMDGNYGVHGGTTTSGMHPDMKRKIGAMQRANPKIKVTSGLRDTGLQQRLKKKGYKNVSGKASAHTRGMAADLGPKSEYGWIAANAKNFGLSSGKSHGEPWHVGMGDIGDTETDFLDVFKALFAGESSGAEGMFDVMGSLLGLITGKLNTDVGAGPAFEADLYERLQQKGAREGITSHVAPPGSLTSGQYGQPGGPIGPPLPGQGPGSSGAGQNAAKALFNAGFKTHDELRSIVAISKRESNWDPTAQNTNGQDKGLMQVNNKAWASLISKLGVTNLLDINQNAKVAYGIYQQDPSFGAWRFSEKSMQWGPPARAGWAPADNEAKGGGVASPFIRTDRNAADQIISAAGIQTIGDMPEYAAASMPQSSSKQPVVFVNTFNLQGGAGGGGANSGIDVRRTVTMMADHLEEQMKQRLARVN